MPVYYIHALFLLIGFILILAGLTVARFFRKKRWWLKFHKIFNILGPACIITGVCVMTVHKFKTGGGHLGSLHAYIGLLIVILSILTPLIGYLQIKIHGIGPRLRQIHRISGRILVLIMVINILSGLRIAGIV